MGNRPLKYTLGARSATMPHTPLVVVLIFQIGPGLTVVLIWRIRKPSPEHRWGLLFFSTNSVYACTAFSTSTIQQLFVQCQQLQYGFGIPRNLVIFCRRRYTSVFTTETLSTRFSPTHRESWARWNGGNWHGSRRRVCGKSAYGATSSMAVGGWGRCGAVRVGGKGAIVGRLFWAHSEDSPTRWRVWGGRG
jgi:hypothetical protein